MGNKFCKCKKNTLPIQATLVEENLNFTSNNDLEKSEPEIGFVSLRRYSKLSQDWYCQDRNCLVSNKISFTDHYFQTTPIKDTQELICNVCQKRHKIKWRYIEENGIVIG